MTSTTANLQNSAASSSTTNTSTTVRGVSSADCSTATRLMEVLLGYCVPLEPLRPLRLRFFKLMFLRLISLLRFTAAPFC